MVLIITIFSLFYRGKFESVDVTVAGLWNRVYQSEICLKVFKYTAGNLTSKYVDSNIVCNTVRYNWSVHKHLKIVTSDK